MNLSIWTKYVDVPATEDCRAQLTDATVAKAARALVHVELVAVDSMAAVAPFTHIVSTAVPGLPVVVTLRCRVRDC